MDGFTFEFDGSPVVGPFGQIEVEFHQLGQGLAIDHRELPSTFDSLRHESMKKWVRYLVIVNDKLAYSNVY